MRGVVAPVFGLLAVLFIVLGTLNMTVWKPAREVSASTSISGTRYIVTDSGMLNLLAKSVNVKVGTQGNAAESSSKSDTNENAESATQTCVALGNAKDATGWLAGQDYTRVTGLNGWKALSTKTATGPKIAATQGDGEVAFKDSDMWTNVKCGDSAITLNLNDVKSDQVMIVDMGASAQKSAKPSVTITMHWVRDRVPNHAMPFFAAAIVCVALTVLSASIFAIMANESFKRKRKKRREVREKAKAEEVSISEAMTGSIAVLKTSLTHSSHNHRPSHKIQPSDLAGAGSSTASSDERGTGAALNDGPLLSVSSDAGLSDVDVSAPSIIDPTRRNLVADMQMQNDTDENAEDTADAADAKNAGEGAEEVPDHNAADADQNNPAPGDSAQNAQKETSAFQPQTIEDTSEITTSEAQTVQSQSAEPESSSESAVATDTSSEQASEDAGAVNTDENNHDMSRFARHRGKPEQESESDAAVSAAHVGRHSRHATVEHGGNDVFGDYSNLVNHDNDNNHGNVDTANSQSSSDDHGNANGHEDQSTDYRDANVAVSLERPEGNVESSDAEHANAQNGKVRTTSSADELIDKNHAQAKTTVISENDLRDYFARLYSEEGSDSDTNDGAGTAQATSEATGETPNVNGDGENA